MGTALKEGLPLKLVKHQGDAVSAAVVCGHKSIHEHDSYQPFLPVQYINIRINYPRRLV